MKILGVAKAALYGIFLNYYCYYVINGVFIPRGTVLFFGLAGLCVGADVLQRGRVYIDTEIKCWIAYAVLALLTSAIVLINSSNMGYISDIGKYVQRTLIIFMVAYICERENSIKFGLRLMAVTAVGLAIAVLSVIGDIQLKLDITSGANLSQNDAGAILAYGCFAVAFGWGRRSHSSLILFSLKTAGVICCLSVIFLTGSRKSIIAVAVMVVLLLLLCFRDYLVKLNFKRFFVVLIVGIVAYLVISETLLPYAEQTSLYRRLFGLETDITVDSDESRIRFYLWALEDFVTHPFFGLGFNQFTKHHGNYTHSTYVEPLACSGLIGLLYLYPYYLIIKKQLYLIRASKKGSYARLKQKEIFVYLCMLLWIAVGIPFMYKDAPCILLGTFIASQTISFRELRTTGSLSADY